MLYYSEISVTNPRYSFLNFWVGIRLQFEPRQLYRTCVLQQFSSI